MSPELESAINDALSFGSVNEQELFDCLSRGRVRKKQEILARISESLDNGATEADFIAIVEKHR